MGYLVFGIFIGLFAGVLIQRWRKNRNQFVAHMEYWVYLPDEVLPGQDVAVDNLFRENPYQRAHRPLTPAEGLLLSDIRLDVSLVLRSKNPHVFRPDLFSDCGTPNIELLSALSQAKAIAKIKFVSFEPLKDDRHLVLLPHFALAYARIGGGLAVYDVVAECLCSTADFAQFARLGSDPSACDAHTKVAWNLDDPTAGHAETKGLIKLGIPELKTLPCPLDHRILAIEVLDLVIETLWREKSLPKEIKVDCFEDEFLVVVRPGSHLVREVAIMRRQGTTG